MQLDYSVLFIDDEGFEGFMGTLKEAIKTYLDNHGFILHSFEIKNETELDAQIQKKTNYDMIFVDNRFDDQECGIDFIKKIRNANIFADIILCTALSDGELVAKIKEDTALHGFYYIRKEPEDLFKHAYNIIDFRFKKELDINVMRGIAMSEVANFDNRILEIILMNNSHKPKIIEKIKEKAKKRYEDTKNSNADEMIWNMVSNPETSTIYFESTTRKDFFHSQVLKNIDTLREYYEAIKDKYKIDILDKRNILAHQITPKLSNDDIKQFRKDLIAFRGIFDKIIKHFNDQQKKA